MLICEKLLKESCKDNCVGDCTCYKYGPGNIDATMRTYLSKRKHTRFSNSEFRKMAGDVMIEFFEFFQGKVFLWPMFGTLLGLVREGDIIPHDEDIDIGFFKSDERKLLEMLEDMHNNTDFVVIRNQFKSIYTIWKDDVFIDLYLYEPTDTEQINQGHRHFYNILKKEAYPFKKINFRDKQFNCLANPEAWLRRYYGNDWKTPK